MLVLNKYLCISMYEGCACVRVAVPLLVPVIDEYQQINVFLAHYEATAAKRRSKKRAGDAKKKNNEKEFLTHSPVSPLPPSPAGASSPASAPQAVADVAMATAEG